MEAVILNVLFSWWFVALLSLFGLSVTGSSLYRYIKCLPPLTVYGYEIRFPRNTPRFCPADLNCLSLTYFIIISVPILGSIAIGLFLMLAPICFAIAGIVYCIVSIHDKIENTRAENCKKQHMVD